MTHPFAGGIPYPWARPEADLLHKMLVRDVTHVDKIDLLFKKTVPTLPQLNLHQALPAIWKEALEQIATAGALLTLCEYLLKEPGLPEVWKAAQGVLDARPAVERRIGHDGRITVDRATLRQQLLQLAVEDAPVKVLLVRGGPNTGKSWSRHLFERASKDRGADMTYLFNGTIGSVEELVRKLFSRLRASERVPEQDTTDPGYYQHVCDRLAEEAARYGRPLWIAVDDLGPGPDGMTPIMDPKIREFFEQFALNLLDPAVHRWFRLLLIHYPDGKVPAQWERELWEEDRPDPGDVRPEDVAAVLREWAASHDKQLLDDEVERLAKEVMARAAAPPPPGQPDGDTPWLRRLNDELKRTLENLGGQST